MGSKITNLLVKKIYNFTGISMWTYGTSGALIKLLPARFSDMYTPEEGCFYVVDEDYKKILVDRNPLFKDHFLKPVFYGTGRSEEEIYKFSYRPGINAVPITDNCAGFAKVI